MNWKGYGRKWLQPNMCVVLGFFVGRIRKNMNSQSRELIFCCGFEICTYRIEI